MLEVDNTGPVLEPDVSRRAGRAVPAGRSRPRLQRRRGRPRAFDRGRRRHRPSRHHDPEATPKRRPPGAGPTPPRRVTLRLAPAIAIRSQPATPNHPRSTGLIITHDLAELPKRPATPVRGRLELDCLLSSQRYSKPPLHPVSGRDRIRTTLPVPLQRRGRPSLGLSRGKYRPK